MTITGTVKWFNPELGFGFITPEGAVGEDEDVFVHQAHVAQSGLKELKKGDRVSFVAVATKKPQRAARSIALLSGSVSVASVSSCSKSESVSPHVV